MPRKGENIYKRKDGRCEGRYKLNTNGGKTKYGYIYGRSYSDVKKELNITTCSTNAELTQRRKKYYEMKTSML